MVEEEEGIKLPSVKAGLPQNIIQVQPVVYKQMYQSLVTAVLDVRDESDTAAVVERLARRYIQPHGVPLSVSAPPMKVSIAFMAKASSMVKTLRMNADALVRRLYSVVERIIGERAGEVRVGDEVVTIDSLPEYAERIMRMIEMEIVAFHVALTRMAALYTLNLPPQYRSAVLNAMLEGIDLVAPEVNEEQMRQVLQQMLEQAVVGGGENEEARPRRRARRRR